MRPFVILVLWNYILGNVDLPFGRSSAFPELKNVLREAAFGLFEPDQQRVRACACFATNNAVIVAKSKIDCVVKV